MNAASVAVLGLGWLGRPLALALHQQGHRVTAARRRTRPEDAALPFAVRAVNIDQADWQCWAGYTTWLCLLPPSASPDYVAAIGRWLRQAKDLGARHVLYSSSISVYGPATGCCNEHTPVRPASASAAKVAAVEALLVESHIEHVDILRLGGLYGGGRHPLYALQQRAINTGGDQPVNMLSQSQAVAAVLQAVQQPGGRRLRNLVWAAHPSRRDFYYAEAARLGVAAPRFVADDTAVAGKIVTTAYADFAAILQGNPHAPAIAD